MTMVLTDIVKLFEEKNNIQEDKDKWWESVLKAAHNYGLTEIIKLLEEKQKTLEDKTDYQSTLKLR